MMFYRYISYQMDGKSDYNVQTALADLERGLRATRIGEQYEAVVKVQDVLNRIPFPVFANVAFLRLAEVFRDGNNSLRSCILQVVERCEIHLDKIISLEEISRRILVVSHSNDPVARSLTLRILGCMAPVLFDRKQIHHLISNSLDSDDSAELQSAIIALRRFAEFSNDFSRGIFDKVAVMLIGVETPLNTRLQLVHVFRYMHSDFETAQKVFRLCQVDLLSSSPNDSLVVVILDSLTHLSTSSLLIIPEQIALLLSHLHGTGRKRIKLSALKNLKLLADHSPHVWGSDAVQSLIEFIDAGLCGEQWNNIDYIQMGLEILVSLTNSKTSALWINSLNTSLLDVCTKAINSGHDMIICSSLNVLLNYRQLTNSSQLDSLLCQTFVSFIPPLDFDKKLLAVKSLKCVCRLLSGQSDMTPMIVQTLISTTEANMAKGHGASLFLETLISAANGNPSLYTSLTPWALRQIENGLSTHSILLAHFLLPPSSAMLPSTENDDLTKKLAIVWPCYWDQYRLARLAARNGRAGVAVELLERVIPQLVCPMFERWIEALLKMCQTDKMLSNNSSLDVLVLDKAVSNLHKAVFFLQAAGAENELNATGDFARMFCLCRLKFVSAIRDLVTIYNCAKLVPASTAAISSEDVSQITARLRDRLSKCSKKLSDCSTSWNDLYGHCFDADKCSLDLITLQNLMSQLMEQAIRDLIGQSPNKYVKISSQTNSNANNLIFGSLLNWASVELEKLKLNQGCHINKERFDFLLDVASVLISQNLHYPRFFFQKLQHTEVTLQLSPQPTGSQTAYSIPSGQQLALKIEGLLHSKSTKSYSFRKVYEVIIRVEVRQENKVIDSMVQRVKPRNNYFMFEFLLHLTKSCVIVVNADLVDGEKYRCWVGNTENVQLRVNVL